MLLNRGLTGALRRQIPDVIICGGYNYLASWHALWWARRRRVPFMAWVESTSRDRRGNRMLVEWLKAKFMASCVGFVVAGRSASDYVKSFGVGDERIHLAPDAVDTNFFAARAQAVRKRAAEHRARMGLPARFFLFCGEVRA